MFEKIVTKELLWQRSFCLSYFAVKSKSKSKKKKSSTKLMNCSKISTNQMKYCYFCCFDKVNRRLLIAYRWIDRQIGKYKNTKQVTSTLKGDVLKITLSFSLPSLVTSIYNLEYDCKLFYRESYVKSCLALFIGVKILHSVFP